MDHIVTHTKRNLPMLAKRHKISHVNIFILLEIARHQRRVVKRKHGQYSHRSAFFGKIGPFFKFSIQERIMSK